MVLADAGVEAESLHTADGHQNLSAALPREPDAVERWMQELLAR